MLPVYPIEKQIFSLDSSLPEKDHRENIQTIGSSGTSTGITNSVRKNETVNNQTYAVVESTPSTTKIIGEKREGENIKQQSEITLAESQFYARTSNTPYSKRHEANEENETIDDLKKVTPTNLYEEKKIIQNQELFINEPKPIDSSF
jgi:hypothetical protein